MKNALIYGLLIGVLSIIWLFALIYQLINTLTIDILPYLFPLLEIFLALWYLQLFVMFVIPLLIINYPKYAKRTRRSGLVQVN